MRPRGRRGDGPAAPARRHAPSTTRWSGWPSRGRCGCRWSTGTATSARSAATTRPAAMRYTECRLDRGRDGHGRGHRRGHRRLRPELRRPEQRAAGPAGRDPEPAGQRHRGHRGRDGHQHGAAQPDRGHRGRPPPAQAPGRQPRAADALRARPGPAHRRAHRRPGRHPGGVPDRPRHLPHPGDGHGRAAQRPQDRHRGHRAALRRRPGEGHRPDQGPGPGQEDHRHLRPEGPDRPATAACNLVIEIRTGFNPEAVLDRAVPAHADGGDVRHQQRRPGRRPAAHARPQGTAQIYIDAPRRRHPAAQRVPAPQAPGPAAPGRRHPHRAAQHRRGHPGHPHQRRLGRGQAAGCARSSTCPRSRRSTSWTPRCAG